MHSFLGAHLDGTTRSVYVVVCPAGFKRMRNLYISYLSDTTAGLLAGKAFIGQMRRSGALGKMRPRQL